MSGDKSLVDSVKEALQPNDARALGLTTGQPPHSSAADTLAPATDAQGQSALGRQTQQLASAAADKAKGALDIGNLPSSSAAADTLAPGTDSRGDSRLGQETAGLANTIASKVAGAFRTDGSSASGTATTTSAADTLAPGSDDSRLGEETRQGAGAVGAGMSHIADSLQSSAQAHAPSTSQADQQQPGLLSKMTSTVTSAFSTATGGGGVTETKATGLGESAPKNAAYDVYPGTTDRLGGAPSGADAVPRVSALDARGSIGKQFTTDGAIGGTADKVGGPLAADGAVGKEFTDRGAVGGAVQDHLGHGDATRK
jgi:hypothetical protein